MGQHIDLAEFAEGIDLDSLSDAELRAALDMAVKIREQEDREKCHTSFMDFALAMWPGMKTGSHLYKMANVFERVARGDLKRVIINIAPRHCKSEFASYLLPAWLLGLNPHKKVMECSHKAELAEGFGRKVRDLIDTDRYRNIFPGTILKSDNKASGRWGTTEAGEYLAVGVGGSIAGRGGDYVIIDDPHSEQDILGSATNQAELFNKAYDWFTSGPIQRLQPGGAIILVMTRWSEMDLTAKILEKAKETGEHWEVIEFPAITDTGEAQWPEFWSIEELLLKKASIPVSQWSAQYMQNPTSEEASLLKREWWQEWDPRPFKTAKNPEGLPQFKFILQSWDTATTANERSNKSACTTWGIFEHYDERVGKRIDCIMLIDAYADKLIFPELKKQAKELHDWFKPDSIIIEAKSAGTPLIYELRAMGIPVTDYTPSRGSDKVARVNAISDIFASGMVYALTGTQFAQEVIEECAAFPYGKADDYVDTVSQALMRFRQGGYVRTLLDDDDDDDGEQTRRTNRYYF